MKKCPKCKRMLPKSFFYPRKTTGGLQSWCIECSRGHGRLRNGSTGIYREETPQSKLDMEDFTFYDFATKSSRSKLSETEIAINNTKSYHAVTFNQDASEFICSRGMNFVRIMKNNITGELYFTFNKEKGCRFQRITKNQKNLVVANKGMVNFLIEQLGLQTEGRTVLQISKNMANTEDFVTYKIVEE